MLVLSRKLGEKVVLQEEGREDIEVIIVDIDRGKIRLGFKAAKSVRIFRQELLPFEPPKATTPAEGKP